MPPEKPVRSAPSRTPGTARKGRKAAPAVEATEAAEVPEATRIISPEARSDAPAAPGALPVVELFTDGACSGNPGPGGWAFILRHPATGRSMERSGGEPRTTNNRMELMGVIEGLRALDRPSAVELYSDSEYVVLGLRQWITGWKAKGWRKADKSPVKNVELWQDLDELRTRHRVAPTWVRGHASHPENERCDRLAVAARERFAHP